MILWKNIASLKFLKLTVCPFAPENDSPLEKEIPIDNHIFVNG